MNVERTGCNLPDRKMLQVEPKNQQKPPDNSHQIEFFDRLLIEYEARSGFLPNIADIGQQVGITDQDASEYFDQISSYYGFAPSEDLFKTIDKKTLQELADRSTTIDEKSRKMALSPDRFIESIKRVYPHLITVDYQILRLHEDGATRAEISDEVGIRPFAVKKRVRKMTELGLIKPGKTFDELEKQRSAVRLARILFPKITDRQIADMLGISSFAVYRARMYQKKEAERLLTDTDLLDSKLLFLRNSKGMGNKEMSEALGIPRNVVTTRMNELLKKGRAQRLRPERRSKEGISEIETKIADLYPDHTIAEIAEKLKTPSAVITYYSYKLIQQGRIKPKKNIGAEKIQDMTIVAALRNGLGLGNQEISRVTGMSIGRVNHYLKKLQAEGQAIKFGSKHRAEMYGTIYDDSLTRDE